MIDDPTAIPMEVDPRNKRMRGIAIHGNTPFDVPFVSQITDTLWTGGCADGLVLPAEIDHVISLYTREGYRLTRPLRSMLAVRMYDDLDGPDRDEVLAIAGWVNVCRKTGPTLVHCQAGLNRSALVAGTAMVLDGCSPELAIALLRSKRSPAVLCNPVFAAWLENLDTLAALPGARPVQAGNQGHGDTGSGTAATGHTAG